MSNENFRARRAPSLFWPVVLIGAGVIWLLFNLGMLTVNPWLVLWRFWPVLLIVAGVEILAGRNWFGSIVSALLGVLVVAAAIAALFFAQSNSTWLNSFAFPGVVSNNAALHTQHLADPLGGAAQADVNISFDEGTYSVSALPESSANLLEGDVSYYGAFRHDVSVSNQRARVELSEDQTTSWFFFGRGGQQWTLKFNPAPEYMFSLNTGSGTENVDLASLKVEAVTLNTGSGSIKLGLPASGQYNVTVNGGSGTVTLDLPDGIAARVEYHAGSGSLSVPRLTRVSGSEDNATYESSNFSQSGPYVLITVNGGSGSVTVE
ncbi:MAG: LiaF transmembrane domain-containing protein [Rudaea sp.]